MSEVENKPWYERLVEYAILALILASLVYGISKSSIHAGTDEASVIKNALEYCKFNSTGMDMSEEPQHAKTELMTCHEVREKTTMSKCDNRSPDEKMWFVSTDGLWYLYGPVSNDAHPSPITIDACYVLIDAKTGIILDIRFSE